MRSQTVRFFVAGCLSIILFNSIPVSSFGQAAQMTLRLCLTVEGRTDFDFRALSVFVQTREGPNSSWKQLGRFNANDRGIIEIPVIPSQWMSVTVETSNPTLRRSAAFDDELDFFELEERSKVTVYLDEFMVQKTGDIIMNYPIDLERAAAVSLCFPPSMKSGSFMFKRSDGPFSNGVGVAWYKTVGNSKRTIIGGLRSGDWDLYYINDEDETLLTETKTLHKGEIATFGCH